MIQMAVYGAGGFGREVRALIQRISLQDPNLAFAGFLDDGMQASPPAASYNDVAISIADGQARKAIADRLSTRGFPFRALVHPRVEADDHVLIGMGSIVAGGCQFTTDIELGNFVILNLNCTVGHDVVIGDYSSIMPGTNISGNVKIGKNVFIGSGAILFQGIQIGDDAIVGAGSVVRHSVGAGQRVAGVPSRLI